MRGVLFLGALMCLAVSAPILAQDSADKAVVNKKATAKFATIPNAPDCFTAAIEHGDPGREPSVMLMKATAGCAVPWHWHPSNEQVMMVSGTARAEVRGDKPGLLQPGDYLFVPSHHVMRFTCSSACTLFVYTDGAFVIHYVNEGGQEISPEEAWKGTKKAAQPKPPAAKKKA